MNYHISKTIALISLMGCSMVSWSAEYKDFSFKSGHASLQPWLLPDHPPFPNENYPTAAKIDLGKKLFFDNRLSGAGNMSCATCHNPVYGWSDALPTAKGVNSMVLGRASPTIINTAYNSIQMWDGRKKSLEDQAMGPMQANVEMNTDIPKLLNFLRSNAGYKADFAKAFPGEKIDEITIARSIASFERTVISNNSPFDHWVRGDAAAMTAQEINGFKLFVNPDKGNCASCHSGANFTDNGFHNIGLASFGDKNPDMGRYAERPLGLMKGAFKTPTLRDIADTGPYFHDGSVGTLKAVVEHYAKGGIVKTNLSPSMKAITLSESEVNDITAFLMALSTDHAAFVLPILPR
jgi:cytochrome c peroxidase